MKKNNASSPYVKNYRLFRIIIGVLGISLPVLLWIFSGILSKGSYWIQPSISHYYYSVMHFFFVAVLVLLGFFLIIYRGNNTLKYENSISTLAGIFAFLIAIYPTNIAGFNGFAFIQQSQWEQWFKYIHFGSATCLFICFAVFCFHFFQKSDDNYTTPEEISKKKRRNLIYRICGWCIAVSIISIGLLSFVFTTFAETYFINYTFVFEWIALWAFGIAWFVKGSEIFENVKNPVIEFIR